MTSTDTADWAKILAFLKPRPPLFCPHEPTIRQQVFLRSEALEVLFGGHAGGGKMSLLSDSVLTPFGSKPMGEIEVGDQVVNPRTGGTSRVLATWDHKDKEAFLVTFDDGATCTVGLDHLWTARSSGVRIKAHDRSAELGFADRSDWLWGYRVMTTAQLQYAVDRAQSQCIDGARTQWVHVPINRPVQYSVTSRNKDVRWPIDPYVLGLLLGDGHMSRAVGLTSADEELLAAFTDYLDSLGNTWLRSEKNCNAASQINAHVGPLREKLIALGIYGKTAFAKSIPTHYLTAPLESRWALMQGLIDTDGYIDNRGHISYCSISPQLSNDVSTLAHSLGCDTTVTKGPGQYRDDNGDLITCSDAYNVWIFPELWENFARLSRKKARLKKPQHLPNRVIVDVTRVGRADMRCITVDNLDGLYLTNDFIVTHNSDALLMAALQWVDTPHYAAVIFRNTFADLALPGSLMTRSHEWLDDIKEAHWDPNRHTWRFPSNATLTFGYLDKPLDHLRYKCCRPDTEVLTIDGWEPIANVRAGEFVASLNPSTRVMTFEEVSETHTYDFDGELVATKPGTDVSFAVTPNHTIWASTQRVKDLRPYRADSMPDSVRIPQWAHWDGCDPFETFEFISDGHNGRTLSFPVKDWMQFLGWWIAEGDVELTGRYGIRIHQKDERYRPQIAALLDRVGINYSSDASRFAFNNKALALYLGQWKGSKAKRIPRAVIDYPPDLLQLLLDALVDGDGTWRDAKNRSGHFVTTSKGLADDVCEVAIRCGYRAIVDHRPYDTRHTFNNVDGECWHVHLHYRDSKDTMFRSGTKGTERIAYKGPVHCLTVPPNHTFLIRHNGRVSWTGNSAEFQFVGFDEVTEIREKHYRYLFSRIRRPSGRMGAKLATVPLRMRCASNPAPNWVRRRFLEEGKAKARLYIPSSLEDNPFVDHSSYRKALAQLDDVERARLERGDWYAEESGSKFKREWFEGERQMTSDQLPRVKDKYGIETHVGGRFEKVVRYWDTASTLPSDPNPDPDWTVGALVGLAAGKLYILDIQRFRKDAAGVERHIRAVADRDGPFIQVRMEQEPGASGKIAIDHYARYILLGYDFDGLPAIRNKEARADLWAGKARRGEVILRTGGTWITDFLDEVGGFPESSPHDDQVDAISGANEILTGLGVKLRRPVEIIV